MFKRLISIHFFQDNKKISCSTNNLNQTLLDLSLENKLSLEGDCEGQQCCSTCHVYINDDYVSKIPEPNEDEEDTLDLAAGYKENSRLACSIQLTKELDGMEVIIPDEVENYYSK